jgi:hypothetical protein
LPDSSTISGFRRRAFLRGQGEQGEFCIFFCSLKNLIARYVPHEKLPGITEHPLLKQKFLGENPALKRGIFRNFPRRKMYSRFFAPFIRERHKRHNSCPFLNSCDAGKKNAEIYRGK